MIAELVRWYNATVCVMVIVVGTLQIRHWHGFHPAERLVWQSAACFNFATLLGTWESLRGGYPGGLRVYAVAVSLTWLLMAVLYRPYHRWRDARPATEGGP